MKSPNVRRLIQAPLPTIWSVLTDPNQLVSDEIGILQLDGKIENGSTIALRSFVSPKQVFKINVSDVRPNESMIWSSGMPLGLFKGSRRFALTAKDGSVEFHMQEVYTGPMAPLITRAIPDLQPSFERFADGLKTICERQTKGETA